MFDLSSVLKPLAPELQRRMSVDAFKRILGAERAAMQGGESQVHAVNVLWFQYSVWQCSA